MSGRSEKGGGLVTMTSMAASIGIGGTGGRGGQGGMSMSNTNSSNSGSSNSNSRDGRRTWTDAESDRLREVVEHREGERCSGNLYSIIGNGPLVRRDIGLREQELQCQPRSRLFTRW